MSIFTSFRRFPVAYLLRASTFTSFKQTPKKTPCFAVINRCYARPVTHEDVRNLTKAEWQEKLTPEQFSVCREQCTEPPFSGVYNSHYEAGTYTCVCCGEELFSSESKFDSGTGWPSFSDAYKQETGLSNIIERPENSVDASTFRTEVICRKCDSHLGHVFEDGPLPAGKRYCINSVALSFESTSQK